MKKARLTEEQIIGILQEHEAGAKGLAPCFVDALFNDINRFCNPRRKHSACSWKSPLAFEQTAAQREQLTGAKPEQVHHCSCIEPIRHYLWVEDGHTSECEPGFVPSHSDQCFCGFQQ